VKWAENAEVAYMPQDHADHFAEPVTVFDWMRARGKKRDDDQAIRATLGRLLFSRDEMGKTVDKLSGGERGRMLFGEIMLKRPNIILMDEPTNHLDMESIEALQLALDNYPGTLVFVSHDREFVSSLATRIIELAPAGIIDFSGSYDDYLRSRGIAIDLKRAASQ
jgi:ATPase subunit of ABC transporter with duplicated ATPase domains